MRVVLAALLFAYTLAIRTWGISHTFWMHYDQIRDWRVALGPFSALPLVGPVTHVGGAPIGPAFYWVLWALRVTVGPFFEYLPHAGGIGQAILHSAADVLVFLGVHRRTGSLPLAIAVPLFVASAPYDLALSSTIWNPMMAVTFAKIATALVLLGWGEREPWRAVVVAATAWCAVQSHVPGSFVAVAVLCFLVAHQLATRGWRAAIVRALLVAGVVASLQIPWLLFWMKQPPGTEGTPVGASLISIATGQQMPRFLVSVEVLGRAFATIQGSPWTAPWLGWLLGASALVLLFRGGRAAATLAVSVGPLAVAWIGFSLWVGGYHDYYYFSLMPAAVLTVTLALTSFGTPRLRAGVAWALLVLAIALQPSRLNQSAGIHRMHEYRLLLRASRAMASRGQALQRIDAPFVPATSSRTFLYEILGGRLSPDASWFAVVDPNGDVRYQRIDSVSR